MSNDQAQKCSAAIRTFASSTVTGCRLNLSEDERIAVAAELYRLADAIAAKPRTHADALARQQAIRRVQWLKSWLKKAEVLPDEIGRKVANTAHHPSAETDCDG